MSLSSSRRAALRVEARDTVLTLDLHCSESLTLVDVSLGGFLVVGPHRYETGESRDFLFESRDEHWCARLQARVVHRHERAEPGEAPTYVTGFAFVDMDRAPVQTRIQSLFDCLLSNIAFVDSGAAHAPETQAAPAATPARRRS